MAMKHYKPITPGRRGMTVSDYSGLSKVEPEKSLLEPLKKNAGRNNHGRITVRHRGGGARRKYRIIDFKRDKVGMDATVLSIEYDPNRTAHIALLQYEDGEKSYIIAQSGLNVNDVVRSGQDADIKPGNALPLTHIPVGTVIHNIELYPGKGAQLVRSAGNTAQLMAREGKYALIRLPSGEHRYVPVDCMATVGQVGNIDHENLNIGKAGRKRHMGWRPTVRGSAMNPNDHPHGGGKVRLQSVCQVLLHHGVNLHVVSKHVRRNIAPINLSLSVEVRSSERRDELWAEVLKKDLLSKSHL